MFERDKLDRFENVALLLKDHCFEKTGKSYEADYEIRALTVFELPGKTLLCFGDKRGRLQVYDRENNEKVFDKAVGGTIDLLHPQSLPGNRCLLFVGVRYKGVYVYLFAADANNGKVEWQERPPIFEENKFISFFYPNIVFDKRGNPTRFESFTCFDDGDFRIHTGSYPVGSWTEIKKLTLPYVLEGYTVDGNVKTGGLNFFLGNSAGNIFYIPFSKHEGIDFPGTSEELEGKKILSIHGAVIESMIPLSDYKKITSDGKPGKPFYPDYQGCMVKSGNKIICVYFERIKGHRYVHTVTKVFPNQLLDIKCLQFDEFCFTAASDIENKIHLIKNITDTEPSGSDIAVIFDGEYQIIEFDDRVYKFCFGPHIEGRFGPEKAIYNAYMGLGNHSVLPMNVYDFSAKLKEATELFYDLISFSKEEAGTSLEKNEKMLDALEEILEKFRSGPSKTAIKQLVLQLLTQLTSEFCSCSDSFLFDHKWAFCRIFYKIIENEERELAIKSNEFLTRVEEDCTISPEVITDLRVHIKKFILDQKSYSLKSGRVKELVQYNDAAGNLVDAMTYRGIIYDRQYDPDFSIAFGIDDGEITHCIPFKPKDMFIICTTKGKVILLEPETRKKAPIYEFEESLQYGGDPRRINNIYMGEEKIYLLVKSNRIISFESKTLLAKYHQGLPYPKKEARMITIPSPDKKSYGTAVCRMPQHNDWQKDECLLGTDQGEIFRVLPEGKMIGIYRDAFDASMILDLRAIRANDRLFIAAAYWNGSIKVFEYFPTEKGTKIKLLKIIKVDVFAVNRLFIFSDNRNGNVSPLIVAGSNSGRCYGIRLRFEQNKEKEIHFVYDWCYRCEKGIIGIHPFSFKEQGEHKRFILVSSMDNCLHILERNGISVNTIDFKSSLAQIYVLPFNTGGSDVIRFVTTLNNKFHKIRFFFKKKIMGEIDRCFAGTKKGYEKFSRVEQEVLLLKFRSIDLDESHFKIRYYLKSEIFDSASRILEEIETIFDNGEFEKKNHALTALIKRLFSEYYDQLFENKDTDFVNLKKLFQRTIAAVGYEDPRINTRVQLYWVRSMLKGCEVSGDPVKRLSQWFLVSGELGKQSKLQETDSAAIVRHFIIHANHFLRVKTLQYIYRFIIEPEEKKEVKTQWDPSLVKVLSDSVIDVLKMLPLESSVNPFWFELEAVRFLVWLVVNYKTTGYCPARLCHSLWEKNISSTFFFKLSDSISIYSGEIKKREEIAEMLQAAGQLLVELKRESPRVHHIFPSLTRFCTDCCDNSEHAKDSNHGEEIKCKDDDELHKEFSSFFLAISTYLEFISIDNFADTTTLEKIPDGLTQKFFNSRIVLNNFFGLSQEIKQYYQEKYEDIYINTLESLTYITFYKIKKTFREIKRVIDQLKKRGDILWLEGELYTLLLRQWENFMKEEIDNNVILDFANAIKEYNQQCISDNKTMDMPLIFRNIFTRLNMMAESDNSYLMYLTKDRDKVVAVHNNRKKEEILSADQLKQNKESNIPEEWFEPGNFSSLEEEDIKERFKDRVFSTMLLKEPGTDIVNTRAVYIFTWDKINEVSIKRLESREILGEFLTTAAYLQAALKEQRELQEEFFRIVSHELNQIIRGLLAWVSNLLTGKMEDKPEMRQEYYERFRHSLVMAEHVVKAILSFRDNARTSLKACNLNEEIEETIKLARSDYKNYGNIQLDYAKESGDYEIITDPTLVSTAVINLLTNARKYNPYFKPVELRLFTEGPKIVIEVEDEGVGIPKNEYHIVFEKFERGSYAKKNRIDGLGIGLAASKKNIELLGGTIMFKSKEKIGSTFRIDLDKNAFKKSHLLVTKVNIKRPPQFGAIKDLSLRQKIEEKLTYDSHKMILTLRGILTEEQYQALKKCYEYDEKTGKFNLKAMEKLHHEAQEKLQKI